jgi:hypothetical protein
MKLLDILEYKVRCTWKNYLWQKKLKKLEQHIINYYSSHPSNDIEIKDGVNYIRSHSICTFPNSFVEKYNKDKFVVHKDSSNGLLYVIHDGKKLFFKRSYNTTTVKNLYCGLITEQDVESPHCYTDAQFKVEANDILFDIGSAEGNIALANIEKVKQVVLFERDREWIEALEATFAPWKEKVTIVGKYVSDQNDENNISIDTFLKNYPYQPSFVKIDVEGAEDSVLRGMKHLIDTAPLKIALCTYHQAKDYERFTTKFHQQGFKLTPSKGIMLYLNDINNMQPPYFRKGLIRIITS